MITRKVWLFLLSAPLAPGAPDGSDLPPLESFFTEPSRFAEQLDFSGSKVAYLGPDDRGTMALWCVATDAPGLVPVRISPRNQSVRVFFWIADKSLVWQAALADGTTRYCRAGAGGGKVDDIGVSGLKDAVLAGIAVSGKDAGLLVAVPNLKTGYPDLFGVPFGGGTPKKVLENTHRVFMWSISRTGKPVAGLRWTDTGAKELVDLREGCGNVIFRVEPGDDLRLLSVGLDGRTVRVLENRNRDLTRLSSVCLDTGRVGTIATDPLGRVDVSRIVESADGSGILGVAYCEGNFRWQSLCPLLAKAIRLTGQSGEDGEVTSLQASANRLRWMVTRTGDREPGSVWFCEPEAGRSRMLWKIATGPDRSRLCATRPISYLARDGTPIPAFLTLPTGGKPPWPLVVFPHGGPHMRTDPGYDGRVQFLASRGYAVLRPNFRGSRGYGKAYMNAADGQWGTGTMQTDLSDGAAEMIRTGIAASRRTAVFGGSYGGYAALAGLAFTPDTYKAGICLFGMSDLIRYVESVPAEWTPYSGDLIRRLGDPSSPAGRAGLMARSPVNHAESITAPLLLYHGLRDPLISPDHTRAMLAAMQTAGKPCEALASEDEGHGFAKAETEMAVYRAIEEFLHRETGGLLGPVPGPAVVRRLAELRAHAADSWMSKPEIGGHPAAASGTGEMRFP